MNKRIFVFIFLLLPLLLISQPVSLDLVVEPYPTPYISDWEQQAGIITLTVTNNESSAITIALYGEIIKNAELQASGYSDSLELLPFEVRVLNNTDFIPWVEGNYQEDLANQIRQTGRLPEGTYTICVEYRSDGATIGESCADFEIVIPSSPDLLNPMDGANVVEDYPMFEWAPVFVPSAMTIQYKIRMCEIETGEDLNYAITKVPLWEEITSSASILYPSSAPVLQVGESYVWQVQLLDENNNPLGENEGKSEIWSFSRGEEGPAGEINVVNDGESDDMDWRNDSIIAGNWTGTGGDYYFCVGTTSGDDNLIPWTFTDDSTHFSIQNPLPEGSEFFVSVKSGENGDVTTSDGCKVDRTPPSSSIKSLPDSVETNFTVVWSGTDNLSGIKEFKIQSKKEDSIFVDWITTSDTSSSFMGTAGKKYYFQSAAVDSAGNEESWPGSPDDSTRIKVASDSIYYLVPSVAYLKITDSTEVKTEKDTTTLKGKAKLVIIPDPFNNFEHMVELVDTSFDSDDSLGISFTRNVVTESIEPVSGSFSLVDSTGLKKVYQNVLNITHISFDCERSLDSRLMVDTAYIGFPFSLQSLNNSNLLPIDSIPITGGGLAFNKTFNKEVSKFGMTFTFKQFALAVDEYPPFIKGTINVALNKKGKQKQNFATDATIGFRSDEDIYTKIVPDSAPMKLIPKKDYVLLDSLWFVKEGEDWKLGAGLKFRYPSPLNKIADTTSVELLIGDDGFNITTDVFTEERTDTFCGKNDWTALKICKYLQMDLVKLRLKFLSENGKLDEEQSYIEMMADLYIGEKTPKRIAIGDDTHNGFRVAFDGDVTKPDIDADVINNPIDIGPIILSQLTVGIDFEPFLMSLSGDIGVNIEEIVTGAVKFEDLKIDEDGLHTGDLQINGGDLAILNTVAVGIGELEFSSDPATISFKEPQGDTTVVNTVDVDSYFRLCGASLTLKTNPNSGYGGGFEELLLYQIGDATNFILKDAWFSVQDVCSLSADLKYKEDPEPLLTFGGSVKIKASEGIEGVAFGKIGKRDSKPTFGIFLIASGLNVNLGYVTLDDVGGGFFYRPLQEDIDKVHDLCGMKRGDMESDIALLMQENITEPTSLKFAIMLYAGMYVQSKEVLDASALLTLTENYFELLAKAKMMKNQGKGDLSLLVSWEPKYAEGNVNFEMDVERLVDVDAHIEFYVYSSEVTGDGPIWAILGNGNVKVFPGIPGVTTELGTEFFFGPPGFFFEAEIEKSIDFWIIDGGYSFGTMFWWERGVSWGAYAGVSAWLKVDKVAGLSGSLEGALIGAHNDIFIYAVGRISAELLGETVYSGSIWVSVGTNGLHGDRGRNSTYDGYLESARNMGDYMEEEMEDLANDIEEQRAKTQQLTEQQRRAAGTALYGIVGGGNILKVAVLARYYSDDIEYAGPNNALYQVLHGILFSPDAHDAENVRDSLDQDTLRLDQNNLAIMDKSDLVKTRINSFSSRVSGTLPQIAEELDLSNPLEDTGDSITINVDGNPTTIPTGVSIDTVVASENMSRAEQMRQDIVAYKDSLLNQVNYLIDDLVFADSIMYGGSNSVNSLCLDYYKHSGDLTQHTISYIDYLMEVRRMFLGKNFTLEGYKSNIQGDITNQANSLSEEDLEELISLREESINFLLVQAGGSERTPYVFEGKTIEQLRTDCITKGMEVWYHIPLEGIDSILCRSEPEIISFIETYSDSREEFFTGWANLTTSIERVHEMKAEVYEYLYDLYDDFSWEYEGGGPNQQIVQKGGEISLEGFKYGGKSYKGYVSQQKGGQTYYNVEKVKGIQTFYLGGQQGGQIWGAGGQSYYGGSQLQAETKAPVKGVGVGTQIGKQVVKAAPKAAIKGAKKEVVKAGKMVQEPTTTAVIEDLPASEVIAVGASIGSTAREIKNIETYSAKRDYIGDILVPPAVTSLSGSFESTEETNGFYGLLELNYLAEHPAGGCFYSVDIPGYTNGSCGIGMGRSPSFYFFKNECPSGNYQVRLTAFSNPGYDITRSGNLPVDYFFTPFENTGGPFNSSLSSVDNTKPSTPVFTENIYSIKEDEIHFTYQSVDNESGIEEYKYAVIDSLWYTYGNPPVRHYNIVRTWTSTGGRQEITVRNLDFEVGKKFYVLGKAKNGAGMWSSEGISGEIVVDTTPPSDFSILDFDMISMGASPDTSWRITAQWTPSTDEESNVMYAFGVGRNAGSDDVLPFTLINWNSVDMIMEMASKPSGEFCFTVKAINGSGLTKSDSECIFIIERYEAHDIPKF